jgi:hypothetical protein
LEGDQNVVRLSLAGQSRFFRLRRQTPVSFRIVDFVPKSGASEVGVTFRPKVTFSQAVNTSTLTTNLFFATAAGQRLPARVVPANDGSFAWLFFQNALPGGVVVRITVVGDAILSANSNVALDADSDGHPGGTLNFDFTTVNQETLPGTTLYGFVFDPGQDLVPGTIDDVLPGEDGILHTRDDEFLLPIAGVELYLLGRESDVYVTDETGRFQFDAVPAGDVKVVINGRTAIAPAGFYFPEMVMDAQMEPGVANCLMMGTPDVYLPRLSTAILKNINVSTNTRIVAEALGAPQLTPDQRSRLTIEIAPNSLIASDGTPLSSGQVGISTVPPELVRDMLPPGVLQHTFDITVQAPDIATFSMPASMTFPNVFNAAPGTKMNFLSFDHTTGRLVIEGTATVSADGLSVRTDPGTGITHPGWHGLAPPGSQSESPCAPKLPPNERTTPLVTAIGLQDYLLFDDRDSFRFSISNPAVAPAADACDPRVTPLVVEIKVEGPAEEFLDGLVPQTFQLRPGENKAIQVNAKAFLGDIKNINIDRLYGVMVKVVAYPDGEPNPLLDERFFVYRYVDAADVVHVDHIASMPDTAIGVTRARPIEYHVSGSSQPTLVLEDSLGQFSSGGFPGEFRFVPTTIAGSLGARVHVQTPGGLEAGIILLRGRGKKQKWFIDESAFAQVFTSLDGDGSLPGSNLSLINTPAKRQDIISRSIQRAEALLSGFSIDRVNTKDSEVIAIDSFNTDSNVPVGTYALTDFTDNYSDGGMANLVALRAGFAKSEQNYRLSHVLNQTAAGKIQIYLRRYLTDRTFSTADQMVRTFGKTFAHEIGHAAGLNHTAGSGRFVGFDATLANADMMAQGADLDGLKQFAITKPALYVALGDHWTEALAQLGLDYFGDFILAGGNFDRDTAPGLALKGQPGDRRSRDGEPNVPDPNVPAAPQFHGAVAWIMTQPTNRFVSGTFDLGEVTADGPGGQQIVQAFKLRNLGDQLLTIFNVGLSGDVGAFGVSGLSLGSNVAARAELPFSLTFDPTTTGVANTKLTIRCNALAGDYEVTFRAVGRSTHADLRLLVPNNNVGGAAVSRPPKTVSGFAVITNMGRETLTITAVSATPLGFTVLGLPGNLGPNTPLAIAPSNSFTFGLSFAPSRTGLQRGEVHITSNDPDTPVARLAVVGTGLAPSGNPLDSLSYGEDFVSFETPDAPNAVVLRADSDNGGNWSFFLPAEQRYHFAIFDPVSGLIAHGYGVTAASGQPTPIGTPVFRPSTAADSDGDGLPDDVELAIGTAPEKADTDGDGVSDYEAVQNGLDPLSAAASRRGTRAAAATAARAIDMATDSNLAAVVEQRSGVAIFDIADGARLRLLARVSSMPDPRRAALAGRWLAVGEAYTGDVEGGLTLFDVSNPTAPRFVQRYTWETINAVNIWNGFVFAGGSSTLYVIDLETGAISDQVELDTYDVIDIVGFGDLLYVLTTGNSFDPGKLYTFSFTFGKLQLLHSLDVRGDVSNHALRSAPGQLFAVHGRGYNLLSLSNAASPAIVTNVINDFVNGFDTLRWQSAALAAPNLMLVGADSSSSGQASTTPGVGLNLFALGAGGRTNSFQYRVPCFNAPRGVSIAWSQAYLADWDRGVRLVRYLPLDTNGAPPTVNLLPSFGTNSVVPGTTVAVLADARDDSQVRKVEFYVNGLLVATDVSFPFEHRFVVPKPQSQNEALRLSARAVDTGGNEGWSEEWVTPIVPLATNSFFVASSQTDGRVFGRSYLSNLWATLNTPLDPMTLSSNNFYIISAGNDGQFGTGDDTVMATRPPRYVPSLNTAFLDFDPPLPSGLYRATLGPGLRDMSGNQPSSNRVWNVRVAHFDVAATHGFVMQGDIDVPGVLDSYTFSPAPGQRLFFRLPTEFAKPIVYWGLLDPAGGIMRQGNLGVQSLGAMTFTNAGTYSFRVGGTLFLPDTGPYQLPVTEVSPPEIFDVSIGTTISLNQPGPGAGAIEVPGAKDVYRFNAAPSETITIDLVRYDLGLTYVSLRVAEVGGEPLIDRWVGFGSLTLTLDRGGAYLLEIGSNVEPGTGTYQIQLRH